MDKIRIGLAGCGSVSEKYLAHLARCPYAEVVAVCDIIADRHRARAREFAVACGFDSLDAMLSGADFDLFLNTTSMPAHYPLNQLALQAGKHVFCEKPFAPTYAQGRELLDLARAQGVRLWGAPDVVLSPQFRCMANTLASGEIGPVRAAHGVYGHGGPSWGPWFYQEGGGALFDLGVYNITTLTGLLGPAKAVTALLGTAVRQRVIEGVDVTVTADDNVMLLMDHGDAVFSSVQTGFVYPVHHDEWTIHLIGEKGAMSLLGWDWAPRGVQVRTRHDAPWETRCQGAGQYAWEAGAAYAAECLVKGRPGCMRAEHALHAVEVMAAARLSATSGQRVPITSSFPWPIAT